MFKKRGRRHLLKLNNNGSTMMIVMVAVSLIAILATVLMAMSYMNYNMKVTELNSKKNFYTAEIVLDQINVGLQNEISESVEDAYIKAMQRYTLEDDNVRNTNFSNYYIGELRERLRTVDVDAQYQIAPLDTDGDGVYDSGLVQYLDSTLQAAYANGALIIESSDPRMESVATSKTDDAGNIVYDAQGLVLYNLRIVYTDSNKFTSVIETDIRLKTPSLTLITKTAMPNVFEYSLVADSGIVGSNNAGIVNFTGNVYAGNDTADPTTNAGGISVTQGHTWNFTGDTRVVSGGPVAVATTGTFNALAGTECWFDNIEISKHNTTSGTLNLAGSTFVADDLTIEGTGANVTLSGTYYGFGNGNGADTGPSSAIILNGKNATLDMSGLNKLMLGGNAYIQTSKATYSASTNFAENNNTDILLGNSLAVKSDQIAYLIPAECIGVVGNTTLIGKNPMTESEYLLWKQYEQYRLEGNTTYANYEMVSFTKDTNTLGKALGEYELNNLGYKTVFRTINGETLCYLYLDLTSNGAADYYKDYYYAAETKMNRYIATYNNRIIINPTIAERETKGTVLSYTLDSDGGEIALLNNTMDSSRTTSELDEISNEQREYQNRFARLKAKLTLESAEVTEDELTKTVYGNLINDAVMNSLPNSATPKTYELEISDTEKIRAVFVNNRGKANYVYTDPSICVIVATGNVNITKDFDGLIITDGMVVVDGGVTITPNKTNVLKMLRSKESADADAASLIATYFRNGDKYSMDTSLTGEVTNAMDVQQISDLIVYENWAKQ